MSPFKPTPPRYRSAYVPPHPYHKYEGKNLWKAVSKGISDLVTNQDLQEIERHEYIVGYLCKVLERRKKTLFSD